MCLFHVSLSCRFYFSLECGKKQSAEGVRWKGVILRNMYVTWSNNSATPVSVEMWVQFNYLGYFQGVLHCLSDSYLIVDLYVLISIC